MATSPDRSGTALLVIDVQKGVVAGNVARDLVVGTIAEVVAAAEVRLADG